MKLVQKLRIVCCNYPGNSPRNPETMEARVDKGAHQGNRCYATATSSIVGLIGDCVYKSYILYVLKAKKLKFKKENL